MAKNQAHQPNWVIQALLDAGCKMEGTAIQSVLKDGYLEGVIDEDGEFETEGRTIRPEIIPPHKLI